MGCSLTVYCSAANKHLVINDKQGNLGWGTWEPCLNRLGVLQNTQQCLWIRWPQIYLFKSVCLYCLWDWNTKEADCAVLLEISERNGLPWLQDLHSLQGAVQGSEMGNRVRQCWPFLPRRKWEASLRADFRRFQGRETLHSSVLGWNMS